MSEFFNIEDSIYINNDTNVGIGITNPDKKLEVVGDIDTTTDYNINGTQVLSATTLGSAVVNSSLTNVGTLSALNVVGASSFDGTTTFERSNSSTEGGEIKMMMSDDTNSWHIDSNGASNAQQNLRLFSSASGNKVQIQSDLEVTGDITFSNSTLKGHMIPDTDDAYDIGSAEYKIRDLYVSDNSMWIGDSHKISISGGKMKFRKRKTTTVPAAIAALNGNASGALTSSGKGSLADMKLKHWKAYMRELSSDNSKTVQDVFRDNAEDYIEDSGSYNWLETGTKTFLTSGNVGIGTQDPAALLSLHCEPEASAGLNELLRLSWDDGIYDTLKGDGTKISFHTSNVNQAPGNVEAGYFGVMKANAEEANTESDITIANNDGTNMVERVRILSDGKVGIGDFSSSTPGYKLDVVGDINFTGSLYQNGSVRYSSGLPIWSNNQQNQTASYMGNVGIGTNDPTTILNINTGSTVGGNTKNCAIKFNNHDAGARFVVWDNGTSVNDYAGLGKTFSALDICIPLSSNHFAFKAAGTELMRINGYGNVGIGTTDPSAKFCIQDGGIHMRNGMGNGDTRPAVTTGANTPTYEIRGVGGGSGSNVTSDDGFLRLRAGGGSATACSSHIDLSGYNTNGDMDRNITFTTYDAERMRIDINGNVGIGDTSPDYKLDVAGDINFTGSLYQNGSAFGGGLWSESSNTATYTTLSVGDVGHGTTWAGIAHSSSTSSTGYAVIQNSSGQTLLNCQSGAKIGFREANQEKMYLQGGVLNVAGNVTAGSMTCNGNLIASGYIQGKQPFCQIQLGGSTASGSPDIYENKNQTANETWQYVYLTHTRTGQTAGGNPQGTWGNSLTYNRSFEYNYGFNDSNTNNSTSANSPSTMYQIKVNVAGIYQFNYMLKMYCESDGSDTEVYCIVQKNATGQWYGVNRKMLPHAKEAVVNGSDMVVMNANDWLCVRVYFRKTSGSINYSYDYGKFSCMMVGKI